MSGLFLLLPSFIAIPVLNANSVDPDQKLGILIKNVSIEVLNMMKILILIFYG